LEGTFSLRQLQKRGKKKNRNGRREKKKKPGLTKPEGGKAFWRRKREKTGGEGTLGAISKEGKGRKGLGAAKEGKIWVSAEERRPSHSRRKRENRGMKKVVQKRDTDRRSEKKGVIYQHPPKGKKGQVNRPTCCPSHEGKSERPGAAPLQDANHHIPGGGGGGRIVASGRLKKWNIFHVKREKSQGARIHRKKKQEKRFFFLGEKAPTLLRLPGQEKKRKENPKKKVPDVQRGKKKNY